MDNAVPGFTSAKNIGTASGGTKMSDKAFNIFQVARIWEAEEIHTSVIAELINPQSKFHDKGADFLDRFLQMGKIGIKLSPEELAKAKVETEVSTNKGRRIDMVISTESLYLPFEVKIWAGDQDAQLWDYYTFAEKEAEERGQKGLKVYYLTPDGHEPSLRSRTNLSDSRERLSDNHICLLSFNGHILPWLKDCMKDRDTTPSDVWEIMKQLHDNIAGQPDIQGRLGTRGFSRWAGENDVLDDIYQKLSSQDQEYDLPWTECTDDYMTFTLNKEGNLEFALRVKRERRDNNQVRLYLICGITQKDGRPDYAAAGAYISKHTAEFNELRTATFREDSFRIRSGKTTWDRFPEEVCFDGAEECCKWIRTEFFEKLNPEPKMALKKNKNQCFSRIGHGFNC